MMEPLVELPMEKWPVLQEKLKNLWPLNVAGFYFLHLNLNYPAVKEAFQFKVYCPFGDMDNGFVAVNIGKFHGCQDCILFPTTRNTNNLELALVNTKLIDWTRKVCIDCVSSVILNSLHNVRTMIGFTMFDVGVVSTFFLDRKTKPFELSFPFNTFVGPVQQHYLQHISEVWPYSTPDSIDYFTTLASNGLSYGLYSNGKLVAWVFLNEYYFLCHLYCEEEYRRNGFAELLMKQVVNDQLEKGNDLYAYVCHGNDKPVGLFRKLGFEIVDTGAYIYVQK